MKNKKLICSVLLMNSLSSVLAEESSDQTTVESEDVEIIIVTAQKREQDITNVPLSVSVADSQALERSNSTNLSDLTTLVPNVAFSFPQSLLAGEFSIRGVASSANSPGVASAIAVAVDEVFLSRPGSFNSSLVDVERIEVLRGPQGTLFGKNSTGGVLNIVTKAPSFVETEIKASARIGNYDLREIRGVISGPVGDSAAAKLTAFDVQRDGYMSDRLTGEDLYNDQNSRGVRARVIIELDGGWEVDVGLDWSEDRNIGDKYDIASGQLTFLDEDGFDYRIASDVENSNDREDAGGSVKVTGNIGKLDFTSVTALRTSDFSIANDLDFTEASLIFSERTEEAEQFSQELRLNGEWGSNSEFIGGLYFEKQSNESISAGYLGRDILPFFGIPREFEFFGGRRSVDLEGAVLDADLERESIAAFLSVTHYITDKLTLQGGGRITRDKQELKNFHQTLDGQVVAPAVNIPIGPLSDEQSETAFSGDLSLSYQIAPAFNTYGRISRGFKGGGYNLVTLGSFLGSEQIRFEPEYVTAYEIGLKGRSPNGFSGSFAAFYYDYSDKQEQVFNGIDFVGLNAQAEVVGFEAESRYIMNSGYTLFAGIGLSDASYDDFENCAILTDIVGNVTGTVDCSDNQLIAAPKWTGFFGLDVEREVSDGLFLVGRADASFRDSTFFGPTNAAAEESESFWTVGGRLGIESDKNGWSVYLWAENLLDDDSVGSAFPIDFLGTNYQQLAPPRTFGIEANFTF